MVIQIEKNSKQWFTNLVCTKAILAQAFRRQSPSWRSTIKYVNALWIIWKESEHSVNSNIFTLNPFDHWNYSQPTFLKQSRVQVIPPKHCKETGCWAFAMITGSIRFILIGNKYQSHWSMVEIIPPNASVILWPSSQQMNTRINPKIPFIVAFISKILIFPWCI